MTRAGGQWGKQRSTVVALTGQEVVTLQLAAQSYFISQSLSQYVAAFPDLAYYVPETAEYIAGGLWRRRPEIGMVLEMKGTLSRPALLDALLRAFRARDCYLVVVDPREQERNQHFYRQYGLATVQTLVQLERRGLDVRNPVGSLTIRPMEDRDLQAVLEVERHSFPWLWWNSEAELLWYATVNGVELFVVEAADQPDRIAGYAGYTVFGREAHLDRLAVHRDFQHHGYGASLLAFCLTRMAGLGARRVALTTQVDNWQSQALYKAFGFRESGWRHEILGIWLKELPEEDDGRQVRQQA